MNSLIPNRTFKNLPFLALIVLISFFFKTKVEAQEQAYTKSLIEKFNNIALNYNPRVKALQDQAAASQYLIGVNKISWLNQISITGNLNQFTLPSTLGNGYASPFFPRYNIGVIIPLGIFFTTPKKVKLARIQFEQDMDKLSSEKEDLRNRIGDMVQEFLYQREQNLIYQRMTENSRLSLENKEKTFKLGTSSLKDFLDAKHEYFSALTKSLSAKRDLMVSQYNLELLIGRSLDDALKF